MNWRTRTIGRRWSTAQRQKPEQDIERTWNKLIKKLSDVYGMSAATTYWWLRKQGQSAAFARRVMLAQVAKLGRYYGGGFDCVPFRKMREGHDG